MTGWVVASNGGAQISFAAIGTPLAFKQPDPNRAWLPVPALPGLPEAFIGTTAVQCGGSADHGAVLAVGATPRKPMLRRTCRAVSETKQQLMIVKWSMHPNELSGL